MKVDKIFNHLIVHVPKGEEYFCIEPVSHPTDGFNLMQVKKENLDLAKTSTVSYFPAYFKVKKDALSRKYYHNNLFDIITY